MNKKFMVLFLITSLFISTSIYGCSANDKEITLSPDVQSDIKATENEILGYIAEGSSYLKENNFESARTSFEKAIAKDKSKAESYLEIKDLYIESKLYDDAYSFIKLAVDNDINKDSMILILDEIKKNFEIVKYDIPISLNKNFSITEYMTIPITISGVPTNVSVKLDNITTDTVIDTSKEGSYAFNASSDEYGRNAVINVIVRKPVIKKIIGFITNYYESDGLFNITFDEAQFFLGEDAKREYVKDGNDVNTLNNGYYLKNVSSSTINYKISSNCEYRLCSFILDDSSKNSAITLETNKKFFSNYVTDSLNKYMVNTSDRTRALLFWITTEDDIITKMEMQFTP